MSACGLRIRATRPGRRNLTGLEAALNTQACEPVAQSVEHVTFNHGVAGSNPAGLASKIKGLYQIHVTGANFRAPLPLHVIMTGRDG